MKIINIILCLGILAATSTVQATGTEAIARVGLDSNPLELSNLVPLQEEEFALAGFYSESNIGDLFYWDVDVEKALYFNDSRVDWFGASAEIKLASEFDIAEVPFAFEVGGNYTFHDETYVAKETGLVATFGGQSIADRFDKDESGYFAGIAYLIRPDANIFIRYGSKDTSYETYNFVDLDNLDNQETTTTIGARLAPRDSGEFFLQFSLHERSYTDRRDRDLDGVQVVDSDLILNRYETKIGYIYKPNSRSQWVYGFTYENRTSNGTHYYESQRGILNIRGDHWLADYHKLAFDFDFQTFFYDESLDQSFAFFDQDDIEQTGGTLKLEYTWVLATLFNTNLGFYANVQASLYDSVDEFYDFQRNQFSAGIRWAID